MPDHLRHLQRLAAQRDGALVERQAVETRAELGGEGLQPVERALLLEGLGIALQCDRRAEDTGATAGAFLLLLQVGCRIGAQEEARIARHRGLAQGRAVLTALGDGQAIGVGPQTALEHGVAVDAQVMGGDGGRQVRPRRLNEAHRFLGGDVFQHHPERGESVQHGGQHGVQEHRLAVEDVDVGRDHLAVDQERHVDLLHALQHRPDSAHVGHAGRRVGGGTGRIELAGGEHAIAETGRDLPRLDLVGQIGGHQRGERPARRQGRQDALAVGPGGGHRGHRRHQVGHHDRPRELARGQVGRQLQHGAIAQMHVPVVRSTQGERLGGRAHARLGKIGAVHGCPVLS